jgi:hypothetical protein
MFVVGIFGLLVPVAGFATAVTAFPRPLEYYQSLEVGKNLSLGGILAQRVVVSPFNLVAAVLFSCAIVHTFFVAKFAGLAEKIGHGTDLAPRRHFLATVCHFFGEVEVVFGLWAVPLLLAMGCNFGWHAVEHYVGNVVKFTEPIFVVVIMAMAATKPVVALAESILRKIAELAGGTVAAWWVTILTVAPFLGSFITEPAAMTIGAMLLARKFFPLGPSKGLGYATVGLLFVNVSIGGALTHFAAPPILMVAGRWHLTMGGVFGTLGIPALVGGCLGTFLYLAIFRGEFSKLQEKSKTLAMADDGAVKIHPAVTIANCLFLAWTVVNLHTPALVLGGLLFFLGFAKATEHYQGPVGLRSPILVGFFLAGLVVHGGLQEWWISPVLGSLKEFSLFVGATVLTAFNDNAAITYLASLVTEFSNNPSLQKAVLSGAVTGGGLTIIANAPNPAGQNILAKYFPGGISPPFLLAGAAIPTLVVALCFNLL